ncbi:hypothetical protein SFRURICE_003229 [Spodoptera frugiperda]|nr:hypothetical protein SFRURICE_003229 [Spodoptera frugiperda]
MFNVTFPTTNTCPNTLPALYDGHSWTEYASYFVIIFKYVSEKNYDTRPIPSSKTLILRHWISRAFQLHGMHNDQNLTPVDFYMKSLVYTEGIGRVS